MIKAFETLLEHLSKTRVQRLELTKPVPRVLRLASALCLCCDLRNDVQEYFSFFLEKFDFSEKETRLFEAILAKEMLSSFSGVYAPSDIVSLGRMVDMTWQEMFNFLDRSRLHIKQNLFEYFDLERPLQSSISLLATITSSLFGHKLKDEDLLRIDGTVHCFPCILCQS